MEEITYKSVLCYDEFLPLEVASFGDGAATKVQFDERMQGPHWTTLKEGVLVDFMDAAMCAEKAGTDITARPCKSFPQQKFSGLGFGPPSH